MIDKEHCIGCENDFYNDNNPYGIEECWSLKNAKLVWRPQIHVDSSPPYKHKKAKRVPSCYRVRRYVFVSKDALDSKGYWKS